MHEQKSHNQSILTIQLQETFYTFLTYGDKSDASMEPP